MHPVKKEAVGPRQRSVAVAVVGGGPAGRAAARAARDAGAETILISASAGTVAWALEEGMVATHSSGGIELVSTSAVVVTTGLRDLHACFPGCHLEGVLGAREALAVDMKGLRTAIAGPPDLVAGVTARLEAAGAKVVATAALALAAVGDMRCEAVMLAEADRNWRPVGRPRRVAVERLVQVYGFLPEAEALAAAGAAIGSVPATSVPWLFAAGACAGLCEEPQAVTEGTLAGIGAAVYAGNLSPVEAEERGRELREVLRRVVRPEWATPPPAGFHDLATPDSVLCRCEGVTLAAVLSALPASDDPGFVRKLTRVGMGLCQGRRCDHLLVGHLARRAGREISELQPPHPRIPLRPVPAAALAWPMPLVPPADVL